MKGYRCGEGRREHRGDRKRGSMEWRMGEERERRAGEGEMEEDKEFTIQQMVQNGKRERSTRVPEKGMEREEMVKSDKVQARKRGKEEKVLGEGGREIMQSVWWGGGVVRTYLGKVYALEGGKGEDVEAREKERGDGEGGGEDTVGETRGERRAGSRGEDRSAGRMSESRVAIRPLFPGHCPLF